MSNTTDARTVASQPRRRRPTLVQLRAFTAVCEAGGVVEGARLLGLSQPTVSQALADLESIVGRQLVERGRRFLITAAGQQLLPRANAVVAAGEAFDEAVAQGQSQTPLLTIGIIPTIAPYLLPTILAPAERQGIRLDLIEHTTPALLQALAQGRIDVACVALPVEGVGESTRVLPLYRERFVLMLEPEHPWAGRTDVSTAEIESDQLVLLEEGHCLRDQVLSVCRADAASSRRLPGVTTSTIATMVEIVAVGYGITLLPESALSRARKVTRLAVARFGAPVPHRDVALVARVGSARVEEFERLAQIIRDAVRRSRMPVEVLETSPDPQ